MIKRYFREKELSEYLGISITSLYRLRESGEIPYIRIGKAIRYEIKAIQKWIKENSHYKSNLQSEFK